MAKISPLFGPVEKIPIKDICLDPDNPRLVNGPKGKKVTQENLLKHYSNEYMSKLEYLKASIQKEGVLEPIYVIRAPKDHPCQYIVKDGSFRLVVSKQLTEEQEKGNIETAAGICLDVIPAHVFKKGAKDSEILLHVRKQNESTFKDILFNYYSNGGHLKNVWEDSDIRKWFEESFEIGRFADDFNKIFERLEKEGAEDFTRKELEKIAIKLGLGKPPETMSINGIKLIIKYQLKFGN